MTTCLKTFKALIDNLFANLIWGAFFVSVGYSVLGWIWNWEVNSWAKLILVILVTLGVIVYQYIGVLESEKTTEQKVVIKKEPKTPKTTTIKTQKVEK